jgi:hypothetical protein
MVFPEPIAPAVPIFTSYCIDYRYDALSSEFLSQIGYANSYYLATNAGAALPLGYKYCEHESRKKHCKRKCCPGEESMDTLKKSLTTNLEIALTLRPITTVYLLNHQDCGAIRAFLPCSGYPASGEQNRNKEICINAGILTYAKKYVHKKFKNITEIILGLIDSNGSVADYDTKTKKWTVVFVGSGTNVDALWFSLVKDQVVTIDCHC